jgi:hypothetical protein
MKRLASEVLRDLEIRVARLEKSAARYNTSGEGYPHDKKDYGTWFKARHNSVILLESEDGMFVTLVEYEDPKGNYPYHTSVFVGGEEASRFTRADSDHVAIYLSVNADEETLDKKEFQKAVNAWLRSRDGLLDLHDVF